MRNLFKFVHIFRCNHEAHNGFSSRMSVYHILKVKGCFPHGCFYLRGRCRLMLKGKPCYRGFSSVGKKCMGCRFLEEQTVHCQPELQIPENEYQEFLSEWSAFQDWIDEHKGKELDIQGTIDSVKPLFRKKIQAHKQHLQFGGFLLAFPTVYLNHTLLEDYGYARVSVAQQKRFGFRAGDVLWARATLRIDQGRFVLTRLRQVEIERRGQAPVWNHSRALVALKTATHLPVQLPPCLRCPSGTLVDVEDQRNGQKMYRHLYCLEGRKDPWSCPTFQALKSQLPEDGAPASAACLQTNVIVY